MSDARLVRTIAACELRRLLRDRRALLLAVVLPVLLYPLFFWGSDALEKVSEERLDEQAVALVADLGALDAELRAELARRLDAVPAPFEWSEAELAALREGDAAARRAAAEAALEGDASVLLATAPPAREGAPPVAALVFDGRDEQGIESARRVEGVLEALVAERGLARLVELLGSDPAAVLGVEEVDLARPEDAAGLAIGRILPILAVLVLISGASFAALDAFAAEREVGTLETLLVQPVPARLVARAKLLAVLAVALAAGAGNAASFLACAAFGLLGEFGPGAELASVSVPVLGGRLALGALVFLPTAVLVTVALCFVSARARSFREGQNYLLPYTLLAAALAAPSIASGVELDPLLALVPVTGAALAVRDALAGTLGAWSALAALAGSGAAAAWALSRIARTLDAERLLADRDPAAELAAGRLHAARAWRAGFVAVLGVYVLGGTLQAQHLVGGLLATLLAIAVPIALWLAMRTARAAGEPLAAGLGLARAAPWNALGAALAGVGLAQLAEPAFRLQQRVLPMPGASTDAAPPQVAALLDLPPYALVLLLALAPAVCEELLFRGALLDAFRRDLPRWRAVAAQALLFALVHASVYRLAPTFLLGAWLGAVALRSRALLPCVLGHLAYNGTLVLAADDGGGVGWLAHPAWAWALPATLALALLPRPGPTRAG